MVDSPESSVSPVRARKRTPKKKRPPKKAEPKVDDSVPLSWLLGNTTACTNKIVASCFLLFNARLYSAESTLCSSCSSLYGDNPDERPINESHAPPPGTAILPRRVLLATALNGNTDASALAMPVDRSRTSRR